MIVTIPPGIEVATAGTPPVLAIEGDLDAAASWLAAAARAVRHQAQARRAEEANH